MSANDANYTTYFYFCKTFCTEVYKLFVTSFAKEQRTAQALSKKRIPLGMIRFMAFGTTLILNSRAWSASPSS